MANTHTTLSSLFDDVADAIREKTGDTGTIVADTFPTAIRGIKGGFPNGTEWTEVTQDISAYRSVYYANGLWIRGGNKTADGIFYSTDGINWTRSSLDAQDTAQYVGDILYANGVWVVASGQLHYSTDGKTWTLCTFNPSIGTTYQMYDRVYHTGKLWIAIGDNGNYGGIAYSTDGRTWTRSNITRYRMYNFYYANGKHIVTRDATTYHTSNDGMTWDTLTAPTDFNGVCYYKGVWVAGKHYSIDCINWTSSNLPSDIYKIKCNNDILVCSTSSGLYYSTDGKTWTLSNIEASSNRFVDHIFYECGIWLAFTHDGVYYSTDGRTWTLSNITESLLGYQTQNRGKQVAYGNGMWMVVSDKNSKCYTSITWASSN